MEIDRITTDDDLIAFLLDQYKQTSNIYFRAIANGIQLSQREIDFLRWQLKQYEWISVEDRLPEKFKNVLCLYPSKNYGANIVVDYMESDRGYFAEQFRYGAPTHWMPLPTPPTEKEN